MPCCICCLWKRVRVAHSSTQHLQRYDRYAVYLFRTAWFQMSQTLVFCPGSLFRWVFSDIDITDPTTLGTLFWNLRQEVISVSIATLTLQYLVETGPGLALADTASNIMDFNVKKLASGAGLFFTRAVQVIK